MDMYGFYTGKVFDAYAYLGCRMEEGEAVFRTFAPAAERICVIGEFNGWTETEMERIYDGNFWECRIPQAGPGEMYKYRIYRKDGSFRDHCDPYGYGMELRPGTASIIRDMSAYQFGDKAWMKERDPRYDLSLIHIFCRRPHTMLYWIWKVMTGPWRGKPEQE